MQEVGVASVSAHKRWLLCGNVCVEHVVVVVEEEEEWASGARSFCVCIPQFLPEQEWEHRGWNWAWLVLVEVRPALQGLALLRSGCQ